MMQSSTRYTPHRLVLLGLVSLILLIVISNQQQITQVQAFLYSSTSSSSQPVRMESSEHSNATYSQQVSPKSALHGRQFGDMINDIQIECNSDNIRVTLSTNQGFNGMIYPKGLSKNSTCMTEYHQTTLNITYLLPLRSCNTMSTDVEDGVEYFNTVMIQPHRRLVTNQGRGYHIRCRYQTKERTITNLDQQLNINLTQITPAVIGSATMPQCTMKIYSANDLSHEVAAENVRIGDELQLVISLDDQDVYGMMVTSCLVRDGMNLGEQPLIDDSGCPVDEEIMPQFVYAQNLTQASVTFQAHKFPYTSSVYYQCNVRLCFREGGCNHVPPNCDKRFGAGQNYKSRIEGSNEIRGRYKRWVDAGEIDAVASEDLLKPHNSKLKNAEGGNLNIEVFSGLHVDESNLAGIEKDSLKDDPLMAAATNDDPDQLDEQPSSSSSEPQNKASSTNGKSDRDFCLSMRKFAIAISLISIILMLLVIAIMAFLIHRRNKLRESERQGMSIYEHQQAPYSNYGYCRD